MQEEVLSREEIKKVLDDFRCNEEGFDPCFSLWLTTGLRDAEVIGLTWDYVRPDDVELLVSKTLRSGGTARYQSLWSGTILRFM